MKHLVAIGEALIDFAPGGDASAGTIQTGVGKKIKEVASFIPNVGGAPANVCGAYVKLGGKGILLTMLGQDPFGDKIEEELASYGIDVSYIRRTEEANTSLAFVALGENGDREFSFYRKPGADMLYQAKDVPREVFQDAYALHFCSVSLGEHYPMKEAHHQAIHYARENGVMVSFDPNLRPQLWPDEKSLYQAVQEFLPYTDILKLSDEEVEFITGRIEIEEALPDLFQKGISVVLLTRGSEGASVYTRQAEAHIPGNGIKPIDTTGAGDGFIGSFLYQLSWDEKSLRDMEAMTADEWSVYLTFSNAFCGKSIQKIGAIPSYAGRDEM